MTAVAEPCMTCPFTLTTSLTAVIALETALMAAAAAVKAAAEAALAVTRVAPVRVTVVHQVLPMAGVGGEAAA